MEVRNNFTIMDNGFIDAITKSNAHNYRTRILLVIFKHTAGFHKESTYLSLNDFKKETGINIKDIWITLKQLEDLNMIEWKRGKSKNDKSEFKIKDFSKWKQLGNTPIVELSNKNNTLLGNTPIEPMGNTPIELMGNTPIELMGNAPIVDALKTSQDNQFHDPKYTNINKPGINKPGNKPNGEITNSVGKNSDRNNISPPTQPSTSFLKKEVAKKKNIGGKKKKEKEENEIGKKVKLFFEFVCFAYQHFYSQKHPQPPKYVWAQLMRILKERFSGELTPMICYYAYFIATRKFNKFEYWQNHSLTTFIQKFDNVVVQAHKPEHREEVQDILESCIKVLEKKAPELLQKIREKTKNDKDIKLLKGGKL